MFVREMPADRGMLFIFQVPQPAAFWMKDTYLSLDLIFIDPQGRVLNIARDARPFSLTPIRSDGPIIAVLELTGGNGRAHRSRPGRSHRTAGFANDISARDPVLVDRNAVSRALLTHKWVH